MENDLGGKSYVPDYEVSDSDKQLAMITHISIIFAGFIVPLIIWLIKKDESEFLRKNALEALSFSIANWILLILIIGLSAALMCIFIGMITIFLAFVPALLMVIYGIVAGIHANEGKVYEYPVTSQFVK